MIPTKMPQSELDSFPPTSGVLHAIVIETYISESDMEH